MTFRSGTCIGGRMFSMVMVLRTCEPEIGDTGAAGAGWAAGADAAGASGAGAAGAGATGAAGATAAVAGACTGFFTCGLCVSL